MGDSALAVGKWHEEKLKIVCIYFYSDYLIYFSNFDYQISFFFQLKTKKLTAVISYLRNLIISMFKLSSKYVFDGSSLFKNDLA